MKLWKTLVCSVLAVLMLVPSAFAASPTPPDVQGHWAQEELESALNSYLIHGYPDGTFRPNDTITRAEFLKMLLNTIVYIPYWIQAHGVTVDKQGNLIPYEPQALSDMENHWLSKGDYFAQIVALGLVVPSDYSDGMFHPSKPITRYEIAVMLTRAMGKVYSASQPLTEKLSFTDADQIPAWVRGYVSEAVKTGVLTGYPDGTFRYNKSATRAEAVVMIQRMLDYTREGVNPDINLSLKYIPDENSSDEIAQMTTARVGMQLVDGIVYASLYDIIHMQQQMMGDQSVEISWDPIHQQMFVAMGRSAQYRAGTEYYSDNENFSYYEITADKHSASFRAPTRMLGDELMIPIYDFNGDYSVRNTWDAEWNEATRTLTLEVYNPGGD